MTRIDMLSLVKRLPVPNRGPKGNTPMDDAKLAAVLNAARVAPSADNAQTWRFVTVQSEVGKKQLANAAHSSFSQNLLACHTIVVVCGVSWVITRTRREQPFVYIDVPIAVSHMILQATELELACSWTLDVNEEVVRRCLNIPNSVRVVAMVGFC